MRQIKSKILCIFLLVLLTGTSFGSTGLPSSESTDNNSSTDRGLSDPMDSPWPMYCHDVRHTGRSPYSTAGNPGTEKWRYKLDTDGYFAYFAPIIDDEGISYVHRGDLYAIYPNGTLKWRTDLPYWSESTPAIDENGIIYTGFYGGPPDLLYAIYSSNGSKKWKYRCSGDLDSSPAIGKDGTVYFGDWGHRFHAVYPNGTAKWVFKAGHIITSSPAIGDDGTIYFGSHDTYFYALNPNGTVKWKYRSGEWNHASPSIGDNGIVYCGLGDGYLYAFYPNNGSVKWKTKLGPSWTSPVIDSAGTLYLGTFKQRFYAVNSADGSVKWSYQAPGRIWFGNAATLSADGTVYFCTTTMDGGTGAFIALDTTDGSEQFRISGDGFLYESSPAIGSDGTVYVGSYRRWDEYGYLHAYGTQDSNEPPAPPVIEGPDEGWLRTGIGFNVTAVDPDNNPLVYYVDWGDGEVTEWFGDPYPSGDTARVSHVFDEKGAYTVRMKAKDTFDAESTWAEWTITIGGPRVWINDLRGGIGIKAVIENVEGEPVHDINWTMTFDDAFFLNVLLLPLFRKRSGTITSIDGSGLGKIKRTRVLVFGFGLYDVTVTAGMATREERVIILGPVVLAYAER